MELLIYDAVYFNQKGKKKLESSLNGAFIIAREQIYLAARADPTVGRPERQANMTRQP